MCVWSLCRCPREKSLKVKWTYLSSVGDTFLPRAKYILLSNRKIEKKESFRMSFPINLAKAASRSDSFLVMLSVVTQTVTTHYRIKYEFKYQIKIVLPWRNILTQIFSYLQNMWQQHRISRNRIKSIIKQWKNKN